RLLFEWAVLARNGSYRGIQLGIWEGGKARYVVKMSALKGKSLRTARFAPDGCNFLYQCDGELWWSDLRGRYQRKVLNGISAFTVWHPTKYALRLLREAKDAESELNALIDAVPWGNEVRKVGFTNAHLQRVRHAIANRIVHLVNAIEGKPLRMPKRRRLKLRISLLPPTSALAKPVPTIVIPRVDTPPSIDGKLDDACWRVAGIASQFREHLTGEPMPREIQTYALAGFDMQALYVAFVCAERDIARVRAPRTGRDPHGIWIDDSVELFVAHPHERSRYAHFIVNAAGALYDEVGQDVSWNANVRVATNRKSVALPRALVDLRGRAWCVEMAIPWRELPFKFSPRNDGASLLINFCRNHNTGANEVAHSAWSATFGWFHNPDRFGIAILQRGDISVQLVEVPRLWGRQNLTVQLINCVAQRKVVKVSAYVKSARASSWRRHISVPLESRGHSTVRIPLTLSDVGDVVIILRVKSDDVVSEIPIATRIPQPIEATAPVVFAKDGVARIGWQI
ncbi:MAG TPA: hypothetical protein EYP10_06845, partial [Armatimonadetes bacterium]|nr:hypothetical protein [Armatimonadota bacterium]